jgi:hypothetical protein
LTRRLAGRPLADLWPELGAPERRAALDDAVARVAALHSWRPSAAISDRLLARPTPRTSAEVVTGAISPLPLTSMRRLVAEGSSTVEPALLREAYGWLARHPDLAPHLDRPGLTVTHQDLHLGNVWWDGRRAALVDLGWVRLASPWHELSRVTDHVEQDQRRGDRGHAEFADQLRRRLPWLDVPRLGERLRYSRIAGALRQALMPVPTAGESPVPEEPLSLLRRLLSQPG